MRMQATICPADPAGYHLIIGLGFFRATAWGRPPLSGIATSHSKGALVHASYLEEARERLLAAGYDVRDDDDGRTAPPPKGRATDNEKHESPPWCGECDQRTRHVDIGDVEAGIASVKRCPRCHPLAGQPTVVGLSSPIESFAPTTPEEHRRSHEGWRMITEALGHNPDKIEYDNRAYKVKCPECKAFPNDLCFEPGRWHHKRMTPHPSRFEVVDADAAAI